MHTWNRIESFEKGPLRAFVLFIFLAATAFCLVGCTSSIARDPAATAAKKLSPEANLVASAPVAESGALSLEQVVAVTQIISNIAVLVALILTLRQLSSTIQQASNSAAQSNAHALNSFYMSLATSDHLARIYIKGRENPSSLDDNERHRFFYTCVAWFTHHEQAFMQEKAGMLPKEFFVSWELALREDLADPGFQEFWRKEGGFFDPPFKALIDGIIEDLQQASSAATN